MSEADRSNWMTVEQFSASMGISRRTAYNWLYAGKLRFERTVGGDIRIDPQSGWADSDSPKTPWHLTAATRGVHGKQKRSRGRRAA